MNEEELNLLDYVRVIRKWKEFIISFTAAAIVATVFWCIMTPWTYKAETTLLIPSQSSKGMEGILALSSMMTGSMINLPTDISQSLLGRTTNFSDILKSKTVAEMIVDGLNLKKYYRTNNKEGLIASIRKKIAVKEQRGILNISVVDRDPKLASDIANYSVIALDEFNKKGNIQFAKRMNIFVKEQMATAKIDLSEAEEKLKKFETQAQMVKISERELMLARLMRDVKVKEVLYTMLLQEAEKSKIDQAKEELFFEVLDPARPPKRPFKPKPFLYSLIALVLGTFMSGFLAFFFEYLESLGVKIPKLDYGKEIKWKEMKGSLMNWRI
jgi:uncharacterized protein involved in exopolysaccharide biosynthesis